VHHHHKAGPLREGRSFRCLVGVSCRPRCLRRSCWGCKRCCRAGPNGWSR
jgi:hypothetical protein